MTTGQGPNTVATQIAGQSRSSPGTTGGWTSPPSSRRPSGFRCRSLMTPRRRPPTPICADVEVTPAAEGLHDEEVETSIFLDRERIASAAWMPLLLSKRSPWQREQRELRELRGGGYYLPSQMREKRGRAGGGSGRSGDNECVSMYGETAGPTGGRAFHVGTVQRHYKKISDAWKRFMTKKGINLFQSREFQLFGNSVLLQITYRTNN